MVSILAGITILLLAAWLITFSLRRSSAAIRHMIWTCAMGAALLYAPVRWFVPQHAIAQPFPVAFEPARVVISSSKAGVAVQSAPASPRERTLSFSEIALMIWGLGSTLLAIRFAMRAWQFRRLVEEASGVDKPFPVPILASRQIPGPLVAGILRPKIMLPEDFAEWAPSRHRAVLAHELAHIRRRDPAILFVAQIATIVYWFHPLCWLAAARLRMESERACDDAVLRIGLRPSSYAGELLDLARLFNPQPAIPMAATSHLESRVKSILDPFVNRSFAPLRTWLAAALVTAILGAPLTVFSLRAQGPGRSGRATSQAAGQGTITGTVTDPTGAVIPAVQVFATNLEGGNKEIATADAIGNFAFNNIPAGSYSLEAHAPGFAAFQTEVTLTGGGTVQAPLRVKVGGSGEQITVVAAGSAKPKPPSMPLPAGRIRVGGNIQAASLTQQVQPVYPAALQAAGVEGTVLLEAVISREGTPLTLNPQNTSVDPAFVSAAIDAVRQWQYRPARLNGEPIEFLTTIRVDFKLQTNGAAVAANR
jgi:TonB family protein